MPFPVKATDKGGDYEKAPVGNHPAVLVAIVDMGTQEQEYQGVSKDAHRAYFVWELVTEKMSGTKGTNHLIALDLTVSLHKQAKLRHWIEARVGRQMPEGTEYDIEKELGQPCLLDVIANKNGYPKINGVKAVPKGMAVPKAQRTPVFVSLDDYREKGADAIPEWIPFFYGKPISETIDACHEITGKGEDDDDDDDDSVIGQGETDSVSNPF